MPEFIFDIQQISLKNCRLLGRTGLPHAARVRRLNGVLNERSGSSFDLNYFAAFVVAAFRTDAMLHTWFLTIWTGNGLRYPQRIVCPALAATRF
jgi:hypothetical protein